MRMWMVNPKVLCRQHLLGEHVETHMFVGSLNKGKNLFGYLEKGVVEVRKLRKRHDELANEMKRRKYKHHSPLPRIKAIPDTVLLEGKVNVEGSLKELLSRCNECRKRHKNLHRL